MGCVWDVYGVCWGCVTRNSSSTISPMRTNIGEGGTGWGGVCGVGGGILGWQSGRQAVWTDSIDEQYPQHKHGK